MTQETFNYEVTVPWPSMQPYVLMLLQWLFYSLTDKRTDVWAVLTVHLSFTKLKAEAQVLFLLQIDCDSRHVLTSLRFVRWIPVNPLGLPRTEWSKLSTKRTNHVIIRASCLRRNLANCWPSSIIAIYQVGESKENQKTASSQDFKSPDAPQSCSDQRESFCEKNKSNCPVTSRHRICKARLLLIYMRMSALLHITRFINNFNLP